MSIKITIPNTSSDVLTFGSANTPTAAQIAGIDSGSSNGQLALYTTASGTSTERVRVDASGNVGIGTAAPAAKLDVANNGAVSARFGTTSNDVGAGIALLGASTQKTWNIGSNSFTAGALQFARSTAAGGTTYTTADVTIDSSGNLLVGTTTSNGATPFTIRNTATSAGKLWGVGPYSTNSFLIYNQSSVGVYLTDGGTSWTSSSDERVKDIIEPITDAASKVCTLRAVIGKYKTDEEGIRRSFLIAQDVQAVLPEAVNVQEDEIGTLGVQYTDVIPLLVAAIQEQQALITQLQADVAALKGASA